MGIAAEFFDETAAENRKLYPNPPHPILLFRGKQLPWNIPKAWDLEPKDRASWSSSVGHAAPATSSSSISASAGVNMRGNAITSIQLADGVN